MIWGNGYETTEYLEVFLRNLLLNGKNELHISGLWNEEKVDITSFQSGAGGYYRTSLRLRKRKVYIKKVMIIGIY